MALANIEGGQPQDLGSPAPALAPEVIELLGEENVTALEFLDSQVSVLADINRSPNPFEAIKGQSESLLTDEERQAMAEVEKTLSYPDKSSPAISATCRTNARILMEGAIRHEEIISNQLETGRNIFEKILRSQRQIETSGKEASAQVLADYYAGLEEVADGLFTTRTVKDFQDIAHAESRAEYIDCRTVGIQKDPELGQRIHLKMVEAAKQPKGSVRHRQLMAAHAELCAEAERIGRKSRQVRKWHRPEDELVEYEHMSMHAAKSHDHIRRVGSDIHRSVQITAGKAMFEPACEMMDILQVMHDKFDSKVTSSLITDESAREAALTGERYIAEKVTAAEEYLRAAGLKFDPEIRKVIHDLKEQPLKDWARQLGRTAIKKPNPYESLPADEVFRRACREARDILVGGGRLSYSRAKNLAKELHGINFGARGKRLEAEESGMLVAIAASRFGSFVSVVERFEAEQPDDQVEKLRHDIPDQHKAIAGFNFDRSLDKLMSLLDDTNDRQALLGCFNREEAEQVQETVEHYWKLRNEPDHAGQETAA